MDLLNGLHCLVGDGGRDGMMKWMGGLVGFCMRSSACSVCVNCSVYIGALSSKKMLLYHCRGIFAWENLPVTCPVRFGIPIHRGRQTRFWVPGVRHEPSDLVPGRMRQGRPGEC